MNMLKTFYLLLSFLKLQMEQRCTPLACYRSVLRLETKNDLHIYPNVTGTLMSWKTCNELGILPSCYPNPFNSSITINSVATTTAIANSPLDKHLVVQEFPTLFDGNINSMEGEQFHIYLTDDAKPLGQHPQVNSLCFLWQAKHWTWPLTVTEYHRPVTEATDWVPPLL